MMIVLVCGALFFGLGLSSVQAASPSLPPRPTMPAATPTPVSVSAPISGGTITLRVDSPPASLWTTVEWQDAAGLWHLVEGWQGTLDANNSKVWWVGSSDLGRGPFRWALYEKRGGKLWATSESFNLPKANRQNVEVHVTGPSN